MRLFSAALLTWLVTAQEPSPITPLKGTQVNEMPILGLGTWYIRGNASQTIAAAIVEGYRHLDCAYIYFNQEEIAPGIKEGMRKANITRKDLWITSKLWNSQHGNAEDGLKKTLDQLGLDYVDLFLVHWPQNGRNTFDHVNTWKQMEKLVGRGTRFIGLANFSPNQVDDILKVATVKPKVLQIELHPYLPQTEFVKSVQSKGVMVTAYAPLANTNPAYGRYGSRVQQLFSHPTIRAVASARGCTPAQAVLAWNMQRKVVVIPKASKIEHQKENIVTLEKCKLTDEDVAKINEISASTQYRMNGNVCDGAKKGCWEGLAMGY